MRLMLALLVAGCSQPLDIGFKTVDLGHKLDVGDPCDQLDDRCGDGYVCNFVAEGAVFCIQKCDFDPCTQPTFSGGLPAQCVRSYCTLSCDPVGATDGTHGCPNGSACAYLIDFVGNDAHLSETTDCVKPGEVGDGGACNYDVDCAPGLTCLNPTAEAGVCRRVCRMGSSGACPPGQSCQSEFSDGTPTVYGVCS
jgi:hypothetical protein